MQACHSYPRQAEVGITPHPELRPCEVALSKVHPPDIAYRAIDDDDLAVIAVVHRRREKGEGYPHEGVDLYPRCPHTLPVGGGDIVGAQMVVDDADGDTLICLPDQKLGEAVEDLISCEDIGL